MSDQYDSDNQPSSAWASYRELIYTLKMAHRRLFTVCSYIFPESKHFTKEKVRVKFNYNLSTLSRTCWMSGNSLEAQECEITAQKYERSNKERLCLQNRTRGSQQNIWSLPPWLNIPFKIRCTESVCSESLVGTSSCFTSSCCWYFLLLEEPFVLLPSPGYQHSLWDIY